MMSEKTLLQTISIVQEQNSVLSNANTSKKRKLEQVDNVNRDILDANSSTGVEDVESLHRQILNSLPRIVHERNDGSNKCQFCEKIYTTFKNLNDHKRLHHPETFYACPDITCRSLGGQKMFDCVREVVSHYIREHHEKCEDGKIICGIGGCKTKFGHQNAFNKHIKMYHSDDEEFYALAAQFYHQCQSSHIHKREARYVECRKKKN